MGVQSKSIEKLLVLKDSVSKEKTSFAAIASGTATTTIDGTLPVYDEKGNLLGYIPLYTAATIV